MIHGLLMYICFEGWSIHDTMVCTCMCNLKGWFDIMVCNLKLVSCFVVLGMLTQVLYYTIFTICFEMFVWSMNQVTLILVCLVIAYNVGSMVWNDTGKFVKCFLKLFWRVVLTEIGNFHLHKLTPNAFFLRQNCTSLTIWNGPDFTTKF